LEDSTLRRLCSSLVDGIGSNGHGMTGDDFVFLTLDGDVLQMDRTISYYGVGELCSSF